MPKPSIPNHADGFVESSRASSATDSTDQRFGCLTWLPKKKFWSKDLQAEEALKEMLKAMKIPWDPRGTGHIHTEGSNTGYLLN